MIAIRRRGIGTLDSILLGRCCGTGVRGLSRGVNKEAPRRETIAACKQIGD